MSAASGASDGVEGDATTPIDESSRLRSTLKHMHHMVRLASFVVATLEALQACQDARGGVISRVSLLGRLCWRA